MGESVDGQRGHRGTRNVLQPGHRQQRIRGAWLENYNAYTGNYTTGSRVSGYNPSTGNRYAGAGGSVSNAYTGNYAAGAHGMDYNQSTGVVKGGAAGVAGNAYTGQSTAGARGFTYNTNTGNGVAHTANNTYADHDGNVYKYNPSSGWQQHSDSGWSSPSLELRQVVDGQRGGIAQRGCLTLGQLQLRRMGRSLRRRRLGRSRRRRLGRWRAQLRRWRLPPITFPTHGPACCEIFVSSSLA